MESAILPRGLLLGPKAAPCRCLHGRRWADRALRTALLPAAWPQLLRQLCRLVAEVLQSGQPGLQPANDCKCLQRNAACAVLHLVKGLQLPVQSATMPFELAQLLLFEFDRDSRDHVNLWTRD